MVWPYLFDQSARRSRQTWKAYGGVEWEGQHWLAVPPLSCARRKKRKFLAIAQGLGVCQATVRARLRRFNEAGPEGLRDRAGSGRRPVYSQVERSRVIQLALSSPKERGKPFCHWTLDLLQEALEQEGCAMRRGRIHQVLRAEGVKWQKEGTWFTSPDPEFAIKRGRPLASTSIPLRAAT